MHDRQTTGVLEVVPEDVDLPELPLRLEEAAAEAEDGESAGCADSGRVERRFSSA
ncbi:hypothetical protein [Microbacterium pygmaeum]|uniref:hypothetical protein n=1 Tax=Microbacterium pygmaeum TaxID=370764 RepID=UPI0012F8993F|nr:hypothetical protein [Microbacterium pygmaeum]